MPVSHIGLTVSYLPAARAFYLAALEPLGYRVITEDRFQIALGSADEAELFICQDPSNGRPSGTHVAFSASSPEQVDAFYAAAVHAGARSHAPPSYHSKDHNDYAASIVDLDNNAIQVSYEPAVAAPSPGRAPPTSSYLSPSASNSQSGHSVLSRIPLRTIVDNFGNTSASPRSSPIAKSTRGASDGGALVSTLIGAAAGAAIAYAMTKAESSHCRSPPPPEEDEPPRRASPPISPSNHSPRTTRIHKTTEYASRSAAPTQHSVTPSSPASSRVTRALLAIEAPPAPSTSRRSDAGAFEFSSPRHRATIPLAVLPPPRSVASSRPRRHSSHSDRPRRSRTLDDAGAENSRRSRQPEARHTKAVSNIKPAAPHAPSAPRRLAAPRRARTASDDAVEAWQVALPPSVAGSRYTAATSRAPHDVPLPLSVVSGKASTVRPLSRRNLAAATTKAGQESGGTHGDQNDGASRRVHDWETVMPEDSISQVEGGARRRRRRRRGPDSEASSRGAEDTASRVGSRVGSALFGGGESVKMTVLGIGG